MKFLFCSAPIKGEGTYAKSLLGESLFYLSRFEESKTVFEDLKLENPDSFFVSAYLIDININLAKYDEAIKIGKDILNANTLDKNDTAYILVNLGWINLKYLNNIDESLEYFNKALKVAENSFSFNRKKVYSSALW